jgi:hypothetical protein
VTWQLLKRIAGTRPPAEPLPQGGDDWRTESQRLHQQILDVLGRALCIRQIDAGSCNGCELEIHALNNPYYNIEGLGIRFVASPRHADMLLVTGPLALNMREAVRLAYEATPEPKLVVAAGECASSRTAMPCAGRFRGCFLSMSIFAAARRRRSTF